MRDLTGSPFLNYELTKLSFDDTWTKVTEASQNGDIMVVRSLSGDDGLSNGHHYTVRSTK